MNRRCGIAWLVVCLALAGAPGWLRAQPEPKARANEKLSSREIQSRLLWRAEINAENMVLRDILARLSAQHEVPIRLDEAALRRQNFDPETQIRLKLANLTLNSALRRMLNGKGLRHVVGDGEIVITDDEGGKDVARQLPRAVDVGGPTVIVERGVEEAPAADQKAAQKAAPARAAAVAEARAAQPAPNAGAKLRAARRVVVQGNAAQQQAQQLRPLLAIERRFLKNVCGLTPEQEAELRKREAAHAREVSQKYLAMLAKVQQGTWRPEDGTTDPRRLIFDVLAAAPDSVLEDDQLSRYREEIHLRAATRRSATARSIVAVLDERMVLSTEQRGKILESLLADWNDAWSMSLTSLQATASEQFPDIPTERVDPFLTAAQRSTWNAIPKVRMVFTDAQVLGIPLQEFTGELEVEGLAPALFAPAPVARPARAGKDAPE